MNRQRMVAMAGLAAVAFSSVCSGRTQAEPVHIWNSWIVPVSNITSILFAKDGIAKHNGRSYVMDALRFQGSTPMIAALASGDIDIALLGYSSFPLAIENGGLTDARLIADEIQDGAAGYYSQVFVVRKDGPIKTVEDLKGKVVGTNAAGSAVDIAMRAMLTRHGIDTKKDITTVEVAFADMKALLEERKVELIPSVLPFSENPELKAQSRVLFTQRDAMGPSELGIWVARQGFIEKNRAAIVDLLEDYLRAVRFYTDPSNHAEAVEIAARVSKLPPAVFDSWLFTKDDYYRDPDGRPNLAALQSNIDLERQEGFLKSPIDIRKYADLSLVEEAAGRLR
jgi:NitT/TauT family transport system substrate-binding protein